MKDLKDKAISIKGKQYVLVSDRVVYFNEQYPNGSITTELISMPDSERVIVKAIIYPDINEASRSFTGYSQAVIGDGMVNSAAALENAETSAVGRALGFMGIGIIESIASADEMNKATLNVTKFATPKQLQWMRDVAARAAGLENLDDIDGWIKEVLTILPTQVPLAKVKTAVDRLEAAGKEEQPQLLDPVVDVSEEDIARLQRGEIAY